MGILDDPDSSLATVTSLSLLDITDNAVPPVRDERELFRKRERPSSKMQMIEPRDLVEHD